MRKTRILKNIMMFWTLFIGIGAVVGSISMLLAPDGSILHMQDMLQYFQVLPFANILFQDYIFSGISLLIVNGITNLTAAIFIGRNKISGAYMGCIFGFTLMLWITIQFIIFPTNVLSISYFIFGALQFICGYLYIILFKQSKFSFNENEYKNIGRVSDTIVIYYSRLGYTKKIAYERADSIGADIYEITTHERTQGLSGFLWLGRYGMHRWEMPIDTISVDLNKYNNVIIVFPIHVFYAASPVRSFCRQCHGKISSVDYISVHFRKDSNFSKAFNELNDILGVKARSASSVVCKFGSIIKIESLIYNSNSIKQEQK